MSFELQVYGRHFEIFCNYTAFKMEIFTSEYWQRIIADSPNEKISNRFPYNSIFGSETY